MKKITLFIFASLIFSFQMFAQPANDDPVGAVSLTVGTVFADNPVVGTNVSATASEVADPTIPDPVCSVVYSGGDVWFSLVVGASGEITIETNSSFGSSLTDTGMTVYSGSIGAFVDEGCDDDGGTGLFSLLTLTGRTPGETLYVRVFEYGNDLFDTFQVSAYYAPPPPPPANDECANAIALTVNSDLNCGTVTSGTIASATDSSVDNCGGTEDDDVWYSFVATSTSHVVDIINITGSTTDLYHAVYDATPGCGSLAAALTCSDPNTSTTSGLTIGFTYYVQVYSWSSSAQTSSFDICIGTPPPPPANDDCANATGVSSLPYNEVVDASGATNNAGFIADCALGMNDGVWYTFTTIAGGTVDIVVSSVTGWDPELAIYSGSCGAFTCIDSADSGFSGDGETLSGVSVSAITQYWINVGQFSGTTDNPEGPFTIDISTSDTTTLPVSEYVFENFKYFPNPVNDILKLRAQSNIQNVSIFNMLGQEVFRISPNEAYSDIDTSALQTGVYFVNVSINEVTETIRIIKQ